MATSITGSFYLTETITLPGSVATGARVQGSIDLGAYVSVANSQAVAVESVDFIYQTKLTGGSDVGQMLDANGAITTQLTDLNPGTNLVVANNQSLIASSGLNIDKTNSIATHATDLYPDNFGPASVSEAFMVVNDTMYLVAGPDGAGVLDDLLITVRIRCRIVKLSSKDWMAIAIQSTASDN